jgi:hypothetical protein
MSKTHVSKKGWRKGIYNPINPKKYLGKDLIVYRSQWEFRMMRFLDLNENVVAWISEQPLIPYINPNTNTQWNYHPDFVIKIKTPTGFKTQMIEIKPKKQTIPPVITEGKRKSTIIKEQMTWAMNKAKWVNAKQYCQSRGWEFVILTEDNLFG